MNGMPQPPRQHLPWSRFGRSRQVFTRDYPFGAARAILFALSSLGVADISIMARDVDRARAPGRDSRR